ncbi:MAG: penicillin-binding protein 2 [Anaerolineae bacterium]|nr:penicillin-binding protein 2 [Anaerolineae bacterium]
MIKRFYTFILVLTCSMLILASCSGQVKGTPAFITSDNNPTPTSAVIVVDPVTPESIGRAFLEAWEDGNYGLMYTLISPQLRSGLTPDGFESLYYETLTTATAITVTALPNALTYVNDQATITFQLTLHTGLFGELHSTNELSLIKADEQWWVDWSRRAIWPDLIDGKKLVVEYQIPPRANIYGKDNAGLATLSNIVTVGIVPERLENEPNVLATLAPILGMSMEDIRSKYAGQPANWYIPIRDISGATSIEYDEQLNLPGIERRERPGRDYWDNGVGAHIIGWVSPIPAESYQEYRQLGYQGDEYVGITGLEAWGESILAGRNGGSLYLVGADGSYAGGLTDRKAIRGRDIHTTIDRDLQTAAETVLGDRLGAVVALDIHTGAVLAMTSGPGYDNNIFIRPTEDWARQTVLSDPNRPLINRATHGQYPAGSVFKIVTLAAALEAGNMDPHQTFECPGYWDGLGVANRKMCWLVSGHGIISLQEGLTASCNVVYYEVGQRLSQNDPLILPTFAKAFGFGETTGLRELGEAQGLVPDPAWKLATYQEQWGTGDTVNMAIGQGYLLVTPLQITRMVAALANGGTLYQPYLVERIEASQTIPETVMRPQAVGTLPISDAHLKIITDAMLGTTTNTKIGTATHRFQGLDLKIAGKTGSAEPAQAEALPHSWFTGFWPADNPEFAMVVLAENAGEGSTVAAPMFRQIIEHYYGLEITPLPDPP